MQQFIKARAFLPTGSAEITKEKWLKKRMAIRKVT